MRRIILQVQLSIDGYMAGPNGEMDWMVWNWDNELKHYITVLTERVDCIILGRKLAQGFIPYWANNPNEEGAEKINKTRKVVFSKTLSRSEWDNTVLARGDLADEIRKLKSEAGKDIIVYGGATFVSSLIKQGLIDEYQLLINPTAIGEGMTIYKELDRKLDLRLEKATSFPCGIVALHYEPRR